MSAMRLSRGRKTADGEPRYFHPNGWVITRERRDWDARSTGPGGRDSFVGPKVYWVVYKAFTSPRRWSESFATLRDARAWCDDRDAPTWSREAEDAKHA